LADLHEKASGPFRLEKEFNAVQKKWVIHLRIRTWSEFLYESVCAYPDEKAAIKKEVVNALEHAFRPMILAARVAALHDVDEQPQGDINRLVKNNNSQGQSIDDDEDHADRLPTNAQKPYGGSSVTVEPFQYVQTIETVLEQLKQRVSGVKFPVSKSSEKINADYFSASRNVSVDTQPFGFTRLSALDFVANNVIVGSVNALMTGKNNPGSSPSLKRALSAFRKGWNDAKLKLSLPEESGKKIANSKNLPRVEMKFFMARLMSVNGLEHIENFYCIPDNVKRVHGSGFQGWGASEWKNFYLTGCREMKGSIVRELYPNYYTKDAANGGKIIPYYSDANVEGAVEAALELSSLSRKDGRNPVAFMFAGLNGSAYEKIKEIMEKLQADPATPQGAARETGGKEEVRVSKDNKEKRNCSLLIDDESSSADDDSSDGSELDLSVSKTGRRQEKDVDSPTKHELSRLLSGAAKSRWESVKVIKIPELSLKLSELSTEDLAEVLRRLDESKLYDALEILIAIRDSEDQQAVESSSDDFMDVQNTSKQETPQKPFRSALPSDIPTPSTSLVRSDLKKMFNERKKDLIKTSRNLF
jgi:hypothetical protein